MLTVPDTTPFLRKGSLERKAGIRAFYQFAPSSSKASIQLFPGSLLPRAVRRGEEGAERVQHPEEARGARERASETAARAGAVREGTYMCCSI